MAIFIETRSSTVNAAHIVELVHVPQDADDWGAFDGYAVGAILSNGAKRVVWDSLKSRAEAGQLHVDILERIAAAEGRNLIVWTGGMLKDYR